MTGQLTVAKRLALGFGLMVALMVLVSVLVRPPVKWSGAGSWRE
ncbi:hypothetical protein [Marinobacter nauticus]|nr:hypothetical protein [Marinobacter nauticus]